MKTLVLDSTELRRDWTLTGLTMRLLTRATAQTILTVSVPAVVVEEIVAHHGRAVAEATADYSRAARALAKLGVPTPEVEEAEPDFRDYLTDRLDEVLGFDVLPVPNVEHAALIARAVTRTPPFDSRGTGYRDALVWENVVQLARTGRDVVLVSADRAFSDADGTLAEALLHEISDLPGSVELVQELAPWLLRTLPWRAGSVSEAIAIARAREFEDFLSQSDLLDELLPDVTSFGFDRAPYNVWGMQPIWTGDVVRVTERRDDVGVTLTDYDIGFEVEFEAVLPYGARVETSWEQIRDGERVRVHGSVDLTLRAVVLFEDDLFDVGDLAWRRSDGTPAGPGVLPAAPHQALFEL